MTEIRQYIDKNRYYVQVFKDGVLYQKRSFSSYEDKQKYIKSIQENK